SATRNSRPPCRSTAARSGGSWTCAPAPRCRNGRTRRDGTPSALPLRPGGGRLARGHVGGDLRAPRLHGPRGVDLELEAVGHLGGHVGAVDVELLVPASELVDGSVLLAQQR